MKKRIAFILLSSMLAIGILSAVFLDQYSPTLPADGQQVLDAYIQGNYAGNPETAVIYARNRERFTADMAHQISLPPQSTALTSPVLYDSDIIQPPERNIQFPFPAQQVWCVTLTQANQPAEFLFLARHDNLYGENWVLYQSDTGNQTQKSVGCR